MNYPSIRIEGGILSPDILDRIEDADGQKPAHFELDSSAKVKDEILRVWADAQDYWRIFQRRLESLKTDSPATTETRNLWIVPLLSLLGYQLEYQARGTEVGGKNYPISHRITNRKQTPLNIIGYREPSGLDRKPEKMALRMSAHAMVQEYLNLSDQLYGIVTNGRLLRVLRDSSRLVKLSYLEFDLDRIFTDGLFADFAILFRLIHATRLPKNEESTSACWLERYHQKSIDEGTRIRDGLRDAVTEALEILGTGFLSHPENTVLRQQVSSGELRPEIYFSHLLRVVYRLLFLMVIEERGLVFPKGVPSKNVSMYFQHYSVQRLRRLAATRGLKIERFHDAWLSLLSTFQLFENSVQASRVGTTVFGGQLFNTNSLGPLVKCRLSNAAIFTALERLCYFQHPETKQRTPVNFGALATEEFGSVYESLLELHPVVETGPTFHFHFRQVAGNERKTTGSYYTPTSLVTCLLDSALDPVLEDRIQNFKALGFNSIDDAVLALNVCDPACGSGHFLIAAAQRIARRLAILRAGDEEPSPDLLRHTLREVIGHCIHGVDVNPMSVELCKVALWLEAVEPGKPLNFLDHHIKCGDSLLGATPNCIRDGIPDKAYEPITGDNKEAAKWMRKLNQDAREGQTRFDFSEAKPWDRLGNLPAAMAKLETLEDETPEALRAKEKLYHEIVEGAGYESARFLYDTWCAAFVWPKQSKEYGTELTTDHLLKIERNPHSVAPTLKGKVQELAIKYRFFHWHIEFPAVFGTDGKGGFDVVLGNPPWEKLQTEEQQFFASRAPEIAALAGAKRKALIKSLSTVNPDLAKEWEEQRRFDAGVISFIRGSGIYRLTAVGKFNTFAIFSELSYRSIARVGRAGCIVPSGIATDDTTKIFFGELMSVNGLISLFDFENRNGIFPGVHRSYKFCLLTFTREGNKVGQEAEFAFFALSVDDLKDPEKRFRLSSEDIELLNPNTHTCPIFRLRDDAELTKYIYRKFPIFLNEKQPELNEYQPKVWRLLNTTDDSSEFVAHETGTELLVPVVEAKTLHQFDHRYATFHSKRSSGESVEVAAEEKANPEFRVQHRHFVHDDYFRSRLPIDLRDKGWFLTARNIARSTDERTFIASIFPRGASCEHTPYIELKGPAATFGSILAQFNSLAFDYISRQKVGGTHISYFIIYQLPILPRWQYEQILPCLNVSQIFEKWLLPRVLELTYTAWDLQPFAEDCGWSGPPFRWDEERRFLLRCELDAAFFHLYLPADVQGDWKPAHRSDGCPYDETPEQLAQLKRHFPTPRDAVFYIMDTFPIVKRKDEEKYNGDYRTKRVILEIYDPMQESIRTGQPYQTRLDPPPGPPTDELGHFIPMSQWDPNHWPSHIHRPKE